MAEIPLSQQEAADLLLKWLQEKRVIHFSISGDGLVAKIPGRLDEVNQENARFSLTKSSFSAGPRTFVNFSLTNCSFEYSDAEHAPEPLRSQLKGYDAILYIYRTGVGLGLAVLPIGELAQL
jgi:hypothetical protein